MTEESKDYCPMCTATGSQVKCIVHSGSYEAQMWRKEMRANHPKTFLGCTIVEWIEVLGKTGALISLEFGFLPHFGFSNFEIMIVSPGLAWIASKSKWI